MLLCFDIGNTNIVVAAYDLDNDKIIKSVRFRTIKDEDKEFFHDQFKERFDHLVVTGIIISSVVPKLTNIFKDISMTYYHINPLVVKYDTPQPLKIMIKHPEELGADLLCDVVSMYEEDMVDSIIIDLGTATKILPVNKNKEYLGGIIAPGVKTSLRALINDASLLNEIDLSLPEHVIGNDTISCLQSGVVYGTISMIDGVIDKMLEELGSKEYKIYLTGGISFMIYNKLKHQVIYDPDLLIKGMVKIYKYSLE